MQDSVFLGLSFGNSPEALPAEEPAEPTAYCHRLSGACPLTRQRSSRRFFVEFRNAPVQLAPLPPHVFDEHTQSLAETSQCAQTREMPLELAAALRHRDAAFQ